MSLALREPPATCKGHTPSKSQGMKRMHFQNRKETQLLCLGKDHGTILIDFDRFCDFCGKHSILLVSWWSHFIFPKRLFDLRPKKWRGLVLRPLQGMVSGKSWCWLKVHFGTCGWPSKNRGAVPPKWMVYFMENPMNKWMIWGYHYFWKHPCWIWCDVLDVWAFQVHLISYWLHSDFITWNSTTLRFVVLIRGSPILSPSWKGHGGLRCVWRVVARYKYRGAHGEAIRRRLCQEERNWEANGPDDGFLRPTASPVGCWHEFDMVHKKGSHANYANKLKAADGQ